MPKKGKGAKPGTHKKGGIVAKEQERSARKTHDVIGGSTHKVSPLTALGHSTVQHLTEKASVDVGELTTPLLLDMVCRSISKDIRTVNIVQRTTAPLRYSMSRICEHQQSEAAAAVYRGLHHRHYLLPTLRPMLLNKEQYVMRSTFHGVAPQYYLGVNIVLDGYHHFSDDLLEDIEAKMGPEYASGDRRLMFDPSPRQLEVLLKEQWSLKVPIILTFWGIDHRVDDSNKRSEELLQANADGLEEDSDEDAAGAFEEMVKHAKRNVKNQQHTSAADISSKHMVVVAKLTIPFKSQEQGGAAAAQQHQHAPTASSSKNNALETSSDNTTISLEVVAPTKRTDWVLSANCKVELRYHLRCGICSWVIAALQYPLMRVRRYTSLNIRTTPNLGVEAEDGDVHTQLVSTTDDADHNEDVIAARTTSFWSVCLSDILVHCGRQTNYTSGKLQRPCLFQHVVIEGSAHMKEPPPSHQAEKEEPHKEGGGLCGVFLGNLVTHDANSLLSFGCESLTFTAADRLTSTGYGWESGCTAAKTLRFVDLPNLRSLQDDFCCAAQINSRRSRQHTEVVLQQVVFEGCNQIRRIGDRFCGNVVSLEEARFDHLEQLESVGASFAAGTSIVEMDLSAATNLQSIGAFFAFDCKKLAKLTLPSAPLKGIDTIEAWFCAETPHLATIDLSALVNVATIKHNFIARSGVKDIVLPRSVMLTTIEADFASHCHNLRSLDLRGVCNALLSIEQNFCRNASALEHMQLDPMPHITELTEYFLSGTNISSFDFELFPNLETIGKHVLSNCDNLSALHPAGDLMATMPSRLKSIHETFASGSTPHLRVIHEMKEHSSGGMM